MKLFICEIGINYAFGKDKNLFLENALNMIDMCVNAAERAGIDKDKLLIKFQKRNPDVCVPEHQKNKEKIVPWRNEPTTYLQYKKDIEFGEDEFERIDNYCDILGIKWTASPWDKDSIDFLKQYDLEYIKIPSAKITDIQYLRKVALNFDNIIFSTGMSTEEEIKECYRTLKLYNQNNNISILHCNSSYPASDSELNLSYIIILKNNFNNATIGYSGHEEGISASIIAVSLGSEIIERHVTLSRSNWGTDQSASIVYDQLYRLMRDCEKVNIWKGKPEKVVFESEEKIKKKLRN